MAHQPVSVTLEEPKVVGLRVSDKDCRFFLVPAHDDPSAQRTVGGSWIHVEFTDDDPDILRATALGLRIVDDLLSGLSLVTGIDFRDSLPVQIVDITTARDARFMVFLNSDYKHRSTAITAADLGRVQGIIAHWDGLPRGNRLRRAGRLFRQAIGEADEVSAFQASYMGLESLEPLLAELLGVRAGAEEVKGKCEKCGFEYTRMRTMLNGVRSYIRGEYHPDVASPEREEEWKRINKLRQDLFHSLADSEKALGNLKALLPAAMHYLHDAICCLSHAHELESAEFRLARPAPQMVFFGRFRADEIPPLNDWGFVVKAKIDEWHDHPPYGFVPRCQITVDRFTDIEAGPFWLPNPIAIASEDDLQQLGAEMVSEP
jgi:hypothetical protein